MPHPPIDIIAIGRVSMDLFSQDVGAPFEEITGFDAAVGGSPSNIAIASSRLGLNAVLLTAVADDEVGRFVVRYLNDEGVDTSYIPTKPGTHTPLALLGVEPPDRFPLVFYRENPADVHLGIDDLLAVPIIDANSVLLSGTALSRGSGRDVTLAAAELARRAGVTTYLDLDLRPDLWTHVRAFGLAARAILPAIDVTIGTEEEVFTALVSDPGAVGAGGAMTGAERAQIDQLVMGWLADRPGTVFVVKRGARGATVHHSGGQVEAVPGFEVEVLNTVGAGDAFAAGLLYGRRQGWDWYRAVRTANACGALVVTRHGCAAAMPTRTELFAFVAEHGGF